MSNPWTKEEDELLITLEQKGFSPKEIALFMEGRTYDSVKSRLIRLRIKEGVCKFEGEPITQPTTTRPMTGHNFAADAKKLLCVLKEELENTTSYPPVSYTPSIVGDVLVIDIADWHVGRIIKDEHGAVVYDVAVFKSRIEVLFREILVLLDEHIQKGVPIKDVVILSSGDLLDGQGIFDTQMQHQELSPPFQVMVVVEAIQRLILSLRDRGLSVRFVGVKGNHGEIRLSGKLTDPLANWDLMAYLILKFWAKNHGDKKVRIEFSEIDYYNFDLKGWKYHIRHQAPVQSETAAGKGKFLGWVRKHNCDALVYGHYHHWGVWDRSGVTVFRGGSLTGADEYSEELAEESSPTQLVWGVNKNRPLTFFYCVDLGKKGRR